MRTLYRRLLLFLLPLFILIGVPVFLMDQAGELLPVRSVVRTSVISIAKW